MTTNEINGGRSNFGGPDRQMSHLSEGLAQDVYGLLAEMSRKIDLVTDRAVSVDDNRGPSSAYSGQMAAPAPGLLSPQFNTTNDEIKKELKMARGHSFGKGTPEESE